jgi:hypothetical protein
MNEFVDGYKTAVEHFRQIIPGIRREFEPLRKRDIPDLRDVTVKVEGDVLDRAFALLDDLSNRDNIQKIRQIFQYDTFEK